MLHFFLNTVDNPLFTLNTKYRPTWSEGSLSAGNMPILGTLILRAAAIFLSLWNSFLATFSFLSADLSANLSTKGSAFSGISNTQSFSLSAAARLNPYSGTHFCGEKLTFKSVWLKKMYMYLPVQGYTSTKLNIKLGQKYLKTYLFTSFYHLLLLQ